MTLGERLLATRQKRKMTQAELAKAAHISQGLIARIERGHVKDPATSITRRLAAVLGVTTDWLSGMYEEGDNLPTGLYASASP